MIASLAFYMFAAVLVLSALMVISARNPVHSVLFLILGFFNAGGLFVLLGAEFIAMILVIVYVGAVAVLFLFVVMMLDISFADLRKGAMQYVPMGLMIGGLLLAELVTVYATWTAAPGVGAVVTGATTTMNGVIPLAAETALTNTEALGRVLYTDYVFPFQVSGLILLVSMVGAIVLTLRQRAGVRRQRVADQNARRREDVIEVRKITPHSGV